MNNKLSVSEIFGPTFQGEGVNIGMPVMFLRLGGCNQHCVWCDTPYTWDWTGRNGKKYDPREELTTMTVDEVFNALIDWPKRNYLKALVISGGEPLLQQPALIPLVTALMGSGWWIEIETAGSIVRDPRLTPNLFTISPKLESSGNERVIRYNEAALDDFARYPNRAFKFVVSSDEDLDEVDNMVMWHNLKPVYLMPEGIDSGAITDHLQAVAEHALQADYRLTTRLQILLYGNKRGV